MSDEPKPKPASEDPKSLQNGLGLDNLLAGDKPITKPVKPSSKVEKVVEKVVEAKVKGEPKPDEKDGAKPEETPDIATLNKQLKDTRDYATKVNKDNQELKKSYSALSEEMKVLRAKLEGTYVEPPPVPIDQLTEIERFKARVEADNAAMIEQFGAETIQKLIWDADGPYQQMEIMDPSLKQRVTNAKRPVQEAYRIVQERQFFEKYGNDPLKIKDAIIAEAREELIAEVKTKLKGQPIETINSLSGVNGAPREVQRTPAKQTAPVDTAKIFTTFAPISH